MQLLISIPAYNEGKVINKVLAKIPKKLNFINKLEVVVIDDGSVDDTSVIALNNGVLLVKHILNRGLGASLKTAFELAKKKQVDILITLDADGQHNPGDIRELIGPIIKKQADVVIGSRLLKGYESMPVSRRFINLLANGVTCLMSGIWSTDSQSGFRAFSKKAINRIELITQGMEVSSEIFREIKNNDLVYKEIPIKPIYTKYSLDKGQRLLNAPNVLYKLLIRIFRR